MFEQMGATVSVSADGKTIKAVKGGASVSVTLGLHEAIIDGDSRPLDEPPILYKGVVLVPVRVISESLGAYVQWVPERRLVVIRYFPQAVPTAPPPALPTPVPTGAPTTPITQATLAPVPHVAYPGYIEAAVAAPRNYNEFSDGQYCDSYLLSGAYIFGDSKVAVKLDFRRYAYVTSVNGSDRLGNDYTFFSTVDGGRAFVPVFAGKQSTLDARLEYLVADPRIFLGASYIDASNSYGYAHLSGLGFGAEKLLDLRPGFDFFGSAFYYPNASGNYTVDESGSPNIGNVYRQEYRIVKYDVGLALVVRRSPAYLYGGFSGDHYGAKQNAPVGQTHDGPYAGLGLKL